MFVNRIVTVAMDTFKRAFNADFHIFHFGFKLMIINYLPISLSI